MPGKMASILALSLLLAMQIGDVQATHCPPSGCPADVTDDVEFIQKRVNVEPPLEKVKADKGGETTDGSINGKGFDSEEGSIGQEEINSVFGRSDSGNGECISLTIHTKSWGYENSWDIPGCYSQLTGGACNGSGYESHRTYNESCCCPGKAVVEITCKCSYGDGWHGGYIHVEEAPMDPTVCVDTPGFKDEAQHSCSDWKGFSCRTDPAQHFYSAAGKAALLANCCESCNVCEAPTGCVDTPDFIDEGNHPCSAWAGFDCRTDPAQYYYSAQGKAALLWNCRASCASCDYTTTTTAGPSSSTQDGKKYCAQFSHGNSKTALVVLKPTTTTTTTTTPSYCVDISGLYMDSNTTQVAFLSQTGCFGLFKVTIHSRVFELPYTVFEHQFTIHAFRLTGNITGMPGVYTLTVPGAS